MRLRNPEQGAFVGPMLNFFLNWAAGREGCNVHLHPFLLPMQGSAN